MKKTILSILLLAPLFVIPLSATHNFGGYISYQLLDADNLEYEFTITTFTDSRSVASHRHELEVFFGHGMPVVSKNAPVIASEEKVVVTENVWRNKYVVKHRFPALDECYIVSVTDPNTSMNYLNIETPTPLVLQTEICLSGLDEDTPNGPSINDLLVVNGQVGKVLEFDSKAIDDDGDQIEVNLITSGTNYKSPLEISPKGKSYNINDGIIEWMSPQREGAYQMRFKVTEYKTINSKKTIVGEIQVVMTAFINLSMGVNEIGTTADFRISGNQLILSGIQSKADISIFTVNGQQVFGQTLPSQTTQMPLNLNKGAYIVVLTSGRSFIRKKVVVL